jgi:hypothetical protein
MRKLGATQKSDGGSGTGQTRAEQAQTLGIPAEVMVSLAL